MFQTTNQLMIDWGILTVLKACHKVDCADPGMGYHLKILKDWCQHPGTCPKILACISIFILFTSSISINSKLQNDRTANVYCKS